jgi:putative ABC transport system permease protein
MAMRFFRERERKLDSELQFHLEQQVRDNLAAGMSADEARRQAVLEFGGLEQIKEQCRDVRPRMWLEQTWQDVRYACRQLARAPGFVAVAAATLALGIGATTAMFTVVNSVLFKPLPYPDSERLVNVRETRFPRQPVIPLAPANFVDFRRGTTEVFESIYAERGAGYNLTGSGEPLRVLVNQVSHAFFLTLRSPPLYGRAFSEADEKPGNGRVVILLHGFWLTHFGGRPEVVGTTIELNGAPYTIVGVMGPEFQRGGSRQMLMPLALTDQEWASRTVHQLGSYARLRPGVTVAQASARLSVIAAQLAQEYPNTNAGAGAEVVSILESRSGSSRTLMFTLLGAVSFLLLLACTNVANLLLARATTREREIAVRVALGAGRGRIARQLLVESLVLSLGGALLALGVAKAGLALLLAYAPPVLPRAAFEIVLDARALLVTIVVAVTTGLAFGVIPAIQGTRVNPSDAMKQGGRTAGSSHRNSTRSALVILQVALALMLLAGAGLMLRSLAAVSTFDPGFNAHGITLVGVAADAKKYDTPEKLAAFSEALLQGYRAQPGVTAVAVAQSLPLQGAPTADVTLEGREVVGSTRPLMSLFAVSPDYFQALHQSLRHGRAFTMKDRLDSPSVAILSEAAADQLSPGVDPIGQRISVNVAGKSTAREVVGVVNNIKAYDATMELMPQVYVPIAQAPSGTNNVLLRFVNAAPTAGALRQVVYAADQNQPVAAVLTFDQVLKDVFSRQRFAMMVFSTFAVIAVLLAAIGIYGVMAFSVSRRTAEFGVRIALGAQPRDLMRLILGYATRLVALGAACGVLGALGAAQFLQTLLYRTPPTDPVVLGGITVLLLAVALLASFWPARCATKVDPIIALRSE